MESDEWGEWSSILVEQSGGEVSGLVGTGGGTGGKAEAEGSDCGGGTGGKATAYGFGVMIGAGFGLGDLVVPG